MKTASFFLPLSLFLACCAGLPTESHPGAGRAHLRPGRDTFAFANETVWQYEDGVPKSGPLEEGAEGNGERYTRRCFVMARAAVQFKKFARFDPAQPRPEADGLARLVRKVCAVPVWEPAREEKDRVVIGGWADLHGFSRDCPELVQDHIGLGWPTYFRPGNFGIIFPPGRAAQERVREEIEALWRGGEPPLLWLVNFPSLSINHAVVVVGRRGEHGFVVYDPNLPDEPQLLEYDAARRTFIYPRVFYFRGGDVDVRVAFRGHFR